MAQWIRRWSTEPEILGSIPSGVVLSRLFIFSTLVKNDVVLRKNPSISNFGSLQSIIQVFHT